MGKNLGLKAIFIIVLVVVALWTLYPPDKTLKPGIDLAGGTSLIYEIDTEGVDPEKRRDLSSDMITVLRRRIDPANIQNLIWRPQGSTRFEIQVPLASAEARAKRLVFKRAQDELLKDNVPPARVMRSLPKSPEERTGDFNDFAHGDPNRMAILDTLAATYDKRTSLQKERDELLSSLESKKEEIHATGLDPNEVEFRIREWEKLDPNELAVALNEFISPDSNDVNDVNEPGLQPLTRYVEAYSQWATVVEQLTDPCTGQNILYKNAKDNLDKLNLTEEQLNFVLEMEPKSLKRNQAIKQLKADFSERAEKIDRVLAAYDEYRPFRGRLDDPADLQRMLKGAGVLEFRILPTTDQPEIDPEEMTRYAETLTEKGPKYASDNNYKWFEIEDPDEWHVSNAVVGMFAEKWYVLASNKAKETLLRAKGEEKEWSLERARRAVDDMGRRAIGFTLDDRGGNLFYSLTKNNPDRPLCILLDDMAISAPNIDPERGPIGKSGRITGTYSETQQLDMIDKLNAGSLPGKLIEEPISVKTIGPSIGADNRDKGIKAGIIGLIVVVLCMLVYYTLAGSIADSALFMNLLFVLGIMALVGATFTLPGIAGIILTIGMSVDANVLIFERIREEQQKGSSLRIAVRNGYQRAFRTIFDANLTTFITAAILYWVASEEIKGFAIVLMLGIVSSMFTALFVTRVIFDLLLAKRIIKEHLLMLNLIGKPNINWMAARPILFTVSGLLIAGGLFVFFTRDPATNNKYDIEFIGGTSVTINLKEGANLSRQEVQDKIREAGQKLNNPALAAARVYSIGESEQQYKIETTETNRATITSVRLTFAKTDPNRTIESIISEIGDKLDNLLVTSGSSGAKFTIATQTDRAVVKKVLSATFADANASEPLVEGLVNKAILAAFGNELEIQQNLRPQISSQEKITDELIDSYPELVDFLGGIRINCEIERAAAAEEIDERLADLRFKPDMRDLNWGYTHRILGPELNELEPNQPVKGFAYISVEPEAGFRELTEEEWTQFVQNERRKVLTAMQLEGSLPRVTQIDPSVGREAKVRALSAIVMSLFAIITYIWIRFGNLRYGLAAIIALVHDVCITLGAITACTYLAMRPIGEALLIGDFKINLAMIAALLTIIGYSLNDTIVVFDRIRENRRKARLNPQIITNSINQTISRTVLTSFTTFIVVLIMYIFGGANLRGFTFAIGFGIIAGTYSSIAIASPVLLLGRKAETKKGK